MGGSVGNNLGGSGGAKASKRAALGQAGMYVSDLVPAGGGWVSVRCGLQSSRGRLAIYYRASAGGISRDNFPGGRAGWRVGSHRDAVDGGGNAMGLLGVVPEL